MGRINFFLLSIVVCTLLYITNVSASKRPIPAHLSMLGDLEIYKYAI